VTKVKVGVVGVGAVGSATVLSLVERGGSCREVVLVDRNTKRADGVAADLRYAAPLSPTVDVRSGSYEDLSDATVVVITAGVNEKAGGATNRSDPQGRLRLLQTNAEVHADIVPRLATAAPEAVVMVVTDPPDPLADLTRHLIGHDRVFSTGTLIDTAGAAPVIRSGIRPGVSLPGRRLTEEDHGARLRVVSPDEERLLRPPSGHVRVVQDTPTAPQSRWQRPWPLRRPFSWPSPGGGGPPACPSVLRARKELLGTGGSGTDVNASG